MRQLIVFFAVLIALAPSVTLAQDSSDTAEFEFVERPVFTDCAPERKCLDKDNFKVYLELRNQYVWLHRAVPALQVSLEYLQESFELEEQARLAQKKRADKMEKRADEIFPKYLDAVKEAEEAKAMSVFGGGLPWLVAALITGAAAGFIGGWMVKP